MRVCKSVVCEIDSDRHVEVYGKEVMAFRPRAISIVLLIVAVLSSSTGVGVMNLWPSLAVPVQSTSAYACGGNCCGCCSAEGCRRACCRGIEAAGLDNSGRYSETRSLPRTNDGIRSHDAPSRGKEVSIRALTCSCSDHTWTVVSNDWIVQVIDFQISILPTGTDRPPVHVAMDLADLTPDPPPPRHLAFSASWLILS